MSENQAAADVDNQIVLVDDIDKFVETTVNWHAKKVQILSHLREVPVGTKMQIRDGEEIELNEENLKAFRAGIDLSLMELGMLPFVSFDVVEEAAPEGTNDAPA